MRRRKATTMQVNVRLDTAVVDRLEECARAHRVSFSEEARQRLISSLNPQPDELSLADYRAIWLRRLRDTIEAILREAIEAGASPETIEKALGVLQLEEAEFSKFYGGVETRLSPYVRYPAVRRLLRGSPMPILPDETAPKGSKS